MSHRTVAQMIEEAAKQLMTEAIVEASESLEEEDSPENGVAEAAGKRMNKRAFRGPHRSKRWLSCSKPELRRTRKGKQIWMSFCKYKTSRGVGVMPRIVSKDPHNTKVRSLRFLKSGGHSIPIR